jgi:outer membrane receptor for ferrienterochelin and colicin
MRIWKIMLTLMLYASGVQSQARINIKGLLKDSSSVALAGASISMQRTDDKGVKMRSIGVFSDNNGFFEIQKLEADTYQLQINLLGYERLSKLVLLSNEMPETDLGIFYLREDARYLKEVVVRSVKKTLEFRSDRILYNVENDPDRLSSSLPELLQKLPMMSMGPYERLQLKGKSSFKVMVNGRLIKAGSPSEVIKAYPASEIKRIELITAPGSRYDAEGTADGIINIITVKRLVGFNGFVNAGLSTLPQGNGSYFLSMKKDKVGLVSYSTLGGSKNRIKSQFLRNNYTDQPLRTESRMGIGTNNNSHASSALELTFEPDTINTFSLYGTRLRYLTSNEEIEDHIGIGSDSELIERGIYERNSAQMIDKANFSGDYIRRLSSEGSEFSVSAALNHQENAIRRVYNRIFDFGQADTYTLQPISKKELEGLLEINYSKPLKRGDNFAVGAKMTDRHLENDYVQAQKPNENTNYSIIASRSGVFKYRQRIYAAYSEYELNLNKFSVKPGLRYEYTLNLGNLQGLPTFDQAYSGLFPSINASFTINDIQQLRFSFIRKLARPGMHYLNPQVDISDPRNTSSGNPYLEPEFLNQAELNWGYSKKMRKININIGLDRISNVINPVQLLDPKNGTANATFLNIGQTIRKSINLSHSDQIGKRLRFNYDILFAHEILSGLANEKFYENQGITGNASLNLRYSLPHTLNLQAGGSYRLGDLSLQGRDNAWYQYQVSASRMFLKSKKLSVSIIFSQPLERWRIERTRLEDPFLYILSQSKTPARNIRLGASWSFGELKTSVSKRKDISADDQK